MNGVQRRRHIQPRGPQPMYIVAGLPKSVHGGALRRLAARFPNAIIKGIPGPRTEGPLYARTYVDSLVRSVGEFAIRKRENGNAQPAPASLTLLFVPALDQESLLQAFDFTVMVAPLSGLIVRDGRGYQLRHDLDAACDALVAAIGATCEARTALQEVVRRLGYRSDNEGLLLPPLNFVTQAGNLVPTFRDIRNGTRAWSDRLADLGPTALSNEDVPFRIQPKQIRRPFVDSRGMAFFIAHPAAYDGAAREADETEGVGGVQSALRALYRFGGAIEPGLHHDAQRRNGSELDGATFTCSRKGRIHGDAPYANVYPNDFVRVRRHTPAT